MAKYQAGDRAKFGGKIVTLEATASGGLQAREEATGRLMGKVHGEWSLEPLEAPAARKAPLKSYEGSAEVSINGRRLDDWTNAIVGLDPIMRLPEDANWPPKFQPLSPRYETQPVRASFGAPWGEPCSAEQIAKDIQEIAATFKAELGADPVRVRNTHDHVVFDLEVKNSTPETLDKMTKAIQRRIEDRLDASLLGSLPGYSAPPLHFQCRTTLPGTIIPGPVYGLLGAPEAPRRHNASCIRCNGPAWEGFFVKKCERSGGCLVDARPESVKQEPFKGEDVYYARGRGISVRHPVQERAAALWHEAVIAQAFGRQGSAELRHARVV